MDVIEGDMSRNFLIVIVGISYDYDIGSFLRWDVMGFLYKVKGEIRKFFLICVFMNF